MDSLERKQLLQRVHVAETARMQAEEKLARITNSKTYIFWQKYCTLRKNTLGRISKTVQGLFWLLIHGSKPKVFILAFSKNQSDFPYSLDQPAKLLALNRKFLFGYDNISGQGSEFRVDHNNFRDTLESNTSHTFARQRAMVVGLSYAIFQDGTRSLTEISNYLNSRRLKLYTAEANGALFAALQSKINPSLFYYSEYFAEKYQSGEKVKGILHQDLHRTSFSSNSFDFVLTSDVMEHVSDAPKAEAEIVRILKPGGYYCFTLPMFEAETEDTVFAKITKNKKIKYLIDPFYHADPVASQKGALVYRFFSPVSLGKRFRQLNCQYQCFRIWSKDLAIIDRTMIINLVCKNKKKG